MFYTYDEESSILEECDLFFYEESVKEDNMVDLMYHSICEQERMLFSLQCTIVESTTILKESALETIFETGKNIIMGIWNTIRKIFQSMIAFINKLVLNGKDFWKLYEKQLMTISNTKSSVLHNIMVKFYPYDVYYGNKIEPTFKKIAELCAGDLKGGTDNYSFDNVVRFVGNTVADTSNTNAKINDAIKETLSDEAIRKKMNKLRSSIISSVTNDTVDSEVLEKDFRKLFSEALRGESDEIPLDEAFDKINGEFMLNSNKMKSTINNAIRDTKHSLDNAIHDIEKLKKEALNQSINGTKSDNSDNDALKKEKEYAGIIYHICTQAIAQIQGSRSVLLASNTVALEAAKHSINQAKSICVKVLNCKHKKETLDSSSTTSDASTTDSTDSTNESTLFLSDTHLFHF